MHLMNAYDCLIEILHLTNKFGLDKYVFVGNLEKKSLLRHGIY